MARGHIAPFTCNEQGAGKMCCRRAASSGRLSGSDLLYCDVARTRLRFISIAFPRCLSRALSWTHFSSPSPASCRTRLAEPSSGRAVVPAVLYTGLGSTHKLFVPIPTTVTGPACSLLGCPRTGEAVSVVLRKSSVSISICLGVVHK